ncbi:P-loop NTPase family protein [Phenylobacterium ferrooxidans]|uniref:ATP-binding protein n=1 Tax=Phenylobacterium ferrooxidans TaxID=2982689 RepID=A0ABW6CJS7_9CAUL
MSTAQAQPNAEFDALIEILRWLKGDAPVFTVTGEQGTGKSRLARNVAEHWSGGHTTLTTADQVARSQAHLRGRDLVIVDECDGSTPAVPIGRRTLFFGTPGAFTNPNIELPSRNRP